MTTRHPSTSTLRARLAAVLAIACMVFATTSVPRLATAENDRVALVVGNSAYQHLPALDNPLNDARGMAAALWEAGFETIELIDANREMLLAGIAAFAKRLNEGTDAAAPADSPDLIAQLAPLVSR
jgi:hypothetical protein